MYTSSASTTTNQPDVVTGNLELCPVYGNKLTSNYMGPYNTNGENRGSISYLPSATFHQLPSISYLPAATFQYLPTGLSTYLQSTVHHLPTSTIRPTTFHLPLLLRYYPSLLDLVTFATFTSKTAGLPCITDGWTTAELRATYPLYRLLTG
ncbi:hypothetical protein SFRURICE_013577 [Spodoptera frugiperda]|nr:hypothetical protein SFRURICE_013577 [Spodoptera frugiperda]